MYVEIFFSNLRKRLQFKIFKTYIFIYQSFLGSYDHLIKVWDIRTADESNALMEMNHEKPVEKILLFPNDSIVISAGGNTIKLWDIASGGKLLHTIENHHKTV